MSTRARSSADNIPWGFPEPVVHISGEARQRVPKRENETEKL